MKKFMSMGEVNRLHEIDLAGVEEVTIDVKDIADYAGRGKNCLIFNLLLENSKLKDRLELLEEKLSLSYLRKIK